MIGGFGLVVLATCAVGAAPLAVGLGREDEWAKQRWYSVEVVVTVPFYRQRTVPGRPTCLGPTGTDLDFGSSEL